MARKVALLMTVGTGIGGSQEVTDNLAHGILKSIVHTNPNHVVFFGSDNSLPTIESLKRQHLEEFDEELESYEFVKIPNIDSFTDYFEGFKSKIKELDYDYSRIVIDYTSGTKTMTMSAAFASMLFRKDLIFVSGKRKDGVVVKGTEKVNTQNLYALYDDIMLLKCKELFNTNRFEAALDLTEDMVSDEKEIYSKLFTSYNYFDNINYQAAFDNFDDDFNRTWPDLIPYLAPNKRALTAIVKEKETKCYYILASLLNNAKRRALENKYDDAIARLYRSFELIAQIRLKEKYDTITSNVDVDNLKEFGLNAEYAFYLTESANSSGKIKLGLDQDFKLLNELGDDLGKFYVEHRMRFIDGLSKRNNSILAHGLKAKTKEEYDHLENLVFDFATKLHPHMDKFIKETEFPKFDI